MLNYLVIWGRKIKINFEKPQTILLDRMGGILEEEF